MDVEARFLDKVIKTSGCWLWTGTIGRLNGYGTFSVRQKKVYAHRWAYEHFVGPIPEGYQVDHLCRVRDCVNPTHLEAVTQEENLRRQAAAVTHCHEGHEYTEKNTRVTSYGTRRCRTCSTKQGSLRAAEKKRIRRETRAPDLACLICRTPIPMTKRLDTKYCSPPCARSGKTQAERERRQAARLA
ncbi:HNH endonuclease signature motif containing protein [Nonomuraea maritima]|uniref:HNH endonuclease signature motif containing protein n=1 Tax=Nonomuraea maritima TaxID=683260 RepID=UPI0037204260